jgi:hypothetical protein
MEDGDGANAYRSTRRYNYRERTAENPGTEEKLTTELVPASTEISARQTILAIVDIAQALWKIERNVTQIFEQAGLDVNQYFTFRRHGDGFFTPTQGLEMASRAY